ALDDDAVRAALERARARSGSPIPAAIQRDFERSLGATLSSVRVHTDDAAAEAAEALDARAFALGQDVYFGAGQDDPASTSGRQLLAHEVAHTVQQVSVSSSDRELEVSQPGDALEHEADAAAGAMLAGEHAAVSSGGGLARAVIQRTPGDGASGDSAAA